MEIGKITHLLIATHLMQKTVAKFLDVKLNYVDVSSELFFKIYLS